MAPGAPATCSAAVRAIWLARPATRVSKVSAVLRRCGVAVGAGGRAAAAVSGAALPAARRQRGGRDVGGRLRRTGGRCRHGPPRRQRPRRARGASVSSSRTGWPARSVSTVSMRPAYWVRIQSSLKRLGTRTDTTSASPVGGPGSDIGGGSGRIQVLNCCSGSSAARRSQPRCQRSRLIVEIFFWSRRIVRSPRDRRTAVIHSIRRRRSSPAAQPGLWCKCLTGKGFFAVIVGFPDVGRWFVRESSRVPHVAARRRRRLTSAAQGSEGPGCLGLPVASHRLPGATGPARIVPPVFTITAKDLP